MKRASLAVLLALCACAHAPAAAPAPGAGAQSVVYVMLDGLRWQEVFRGADPDLAATPAYMSSDWADEARAQLVDVPDRKAALMPFLTGEVASRGALIGDRDHGSCAHVTNDMWFSYPGYNEALTGKPDPRITSNDYPENPNVTWLEWLGRRPGYEGQVRAVTSWDAFPRIVNTARSGVPVDAGYAPVAEDSPELALLNRLMVETPYPFDVIRADSFTHAIALDRIRRFHPRALFISYGETDDFAHAGNYAQYLLSAHRTDGYLRELWETLEADPFYAGRTTMIVTVDHGRGKVPGESWRSHSSPEAIRQSGTPEQIAAAPDGIVGSDETWIAAIGPRIAAGASLGAAAGSCAGANQLAATALTALGQDWRAFDPDIGAPLDVFIPSTE